jgi:hypothetical protein
MASPVDDPERHSRGNGNDGDDEGEELTLVLLPEEGTTGTLRQEALGNIVTYKSSGFNVKVNQKCVVHGFYDSKASPASLLVYEIRLTSDKKSYKRRIRYMKASLRFEADPRKQPAHDPYLVSWEPAGRGDVYIYPTPVSYTDEKREKISATLKKDPVPVEASFEHESKSGKEYDRDDKALCTADPDETQIRGGGRKGPDVIEWQLLENESQELLPDLFGVAMVIRRVPGLNFRVVFSIKIEVDFWYDVGLAFDQVKNALFFKGGRELSKTYVVTDEGKIPDGVKKDNLKELVDRDGLDDFWFFHSPEEVEVARHYGKGAKP